MKCKLGAKADSRSLQALLAALSSCRTRHDAEESISQAIQHAASDEKREYIRNTWWNSMAMWANYAREQSPLLLQTTTINHVQGFYSALMHDANLKKGTMVRYSLKDILPFLHRCTAL